MYKLVWLYPKTLTYDTGVYFIENEDDGQIPSRYEHQVLCALNQTRHFKQAAISDSVLRWNYLIFNALLSTLHAP